MCGLVAASIALIAVSTAYSMHAEHQAAKYNAAVDTQNAKLSDQQAANANAMGSYEADQARIRGNLARGQQMAAMAANGVDVSTGSASQLLGDTAMFTASDERQARINGAQRAYGFQVQSLSDQGAAKYAKWQGKTQMISTGLKGLSSMLSMGASGATAAGGATAGGSGGGFGTGSLLTGAAYNGPGNTNYAFGM